MVHEDKAQFAPPPGGLRRDLPPPDHPEWGIVKYLIVVKKFPPSTTTDEGIEFLQKAGNEEQWKFKAWAECESQFAYQKNVHDYKNSHRREKARRIKKRMGGITATKTVKKAKTEKIIKKGMK